LTSVYYRNGASDIQAEHCFKLAAHQITTLENFC
jgi:hypothetical protein